MKNSQIGSKMNRGPKKRAAQRPAKRKPAGGAFGNTAKRKAKK